jgi:Fic family protein
VVESVRNELLGDRVFNSNAIEGNTLDLRETREILKTAHIELGRKREATEVLNLGKAIKYAEDNLVGSLSALTVQELLNVHKILLSRINDPAAGRFRGTRVLITGAKYQPPRHEDVPAMVDLFFERLHGVDDEVDPVILAVWTHWTIARIHPFLDGNGRMARLWQDAILFQKRLTCAVVPKQDRKDYLAALEKADEGDFNALTQMVAQSVATTLDKYLVAAAKADELDEWAVRLIGETRERAEQKRRLDYLRWSRKMEEIRFEFERCASKLTHLSPEIEIQVQRYNVIEQDIWENLRSGAGAGKTWFFILHFRRQGQVITYIFFSAKHFYSELDSSLGISDPLVNLLISEQIGRERAVRLDEMDNCPLSLREILVVNDKVVARKHDHAKGEQYYDTDSGATDIAKGFISEVLLKRLLQPEDRAPEKP